MGTSSRCWKLTQKTQHTLLQVVHPPSSCGCVLCISRTPTFQTHHLPGFFSHRLSLLGTRGSRGHMCCDPVHGGLPDGTSPWPVSGYGPLSPLTSPVAFECLGLETTMLSAHPGPTHSPS